MALKLTCEIVSFLGICPVEIQVLSLCAINIHSHFKQSVDTCMSVSEFMRGYDWVYPQKKLRLLTQGVVKALKLCRATV